METMTNLTRKTELSEAEVAAIRQALLPLRDPTHPIGAALVQVLTVGMANADESMKRHDGIMGTDFLCGYAKGWEDVALMLQEYVAPTEAELLAGAKATAKARG